MIDKALTQSGWLVQDKKHYNPNAGLGIAVREYETDTGEVDYLLFVDGEPVAIVEASKNDPSNDKITCR